MRRRTRFERNTVGKRVGGARYYHTSAIQWSDLNSQKAIEAARHIARLRPDAFNVVKIEGKPPKRVSLLAYEDFDANAFPTLLNSWDGVPERAAVRAPELPHIGQPANPAQKRTTARTR